MSASKTLRYPLLFALLSLGATVSACSDKEDSVAGEAVEDVRDGLNLRENEKLKDAGEDAADAMKDAADAVKEEAVEAKEELSK